MNEAGYAALDRPEVVRRLFHPRAEEGVRLTRSDEGAIDVLIPVEQDVVIGGRFHAAGKAFPNILFFHGNGEIVADYDDPAAVYNRLGLNFLPVDYRGYGRSSGRPTVSSMMRDSHSIFRFVKAWLEEQGHSGHFILMGRSLGSAPALELACKVQDRVDALILESAFARAEPLLTLLGIDLRAIGFREKDGFRNLDKIREFLGPTLIIHAENDHIIPFSEGTDLFEASGADEKRLVKIPRANHNDIFVRGLSLYMESIRTLASSLPTSG